MSIATILAWFDARQRLWYAAALLVGSISANKVISMTMARPSK